MHITVLAWVAGAMILGITCGHLLTIEANVVITIVASVFIAFIIKQSWGKMGLDKIIDVVICAVITLFTISQWASAYYVSGSTVIQNFFSQHVFR